jgi:hypothetical protein
MPTQFTIDPTNNLPTLVKGKKRRKTQLPNQRREAKIEREKG